MKRRQSVFSCDNLAHGKTAGGGVCDGESNAPGDVYRCDSQFGGARGGAQKRRGVGILQKISLPFFGACGILRRLECRNATGAATERLEASVEAGIDSQNKSPLARFVGGYFLSPPLSPPSPLFHSGESRNLCGAAAFAEGEHCIVPLRGKFSLTRE